MFISGNISKDCCLDDELSSSFDIYDINCYNAFVVLVRYYCHSDFNFS